MNSSTPQPAHAPQADTTCCGPGCCPRPDERAITSTAQALNAERHAAERAQFELDGDALREQVRAGYSEIAKSGMWTSAKAVSATPTKGGCGCGPTSVGGGCCGPANFSVEQLASAIGYSQSELATAPSGANMGLSCGNPTALAGLKTGETVLDLGAGGGFDCFIAGPKVGPLGRVIGVDMTPDMVTKARRMVPAYAAQTGLNNVELRLGEIENLPVADASVDVVISNCVLNLSPDKARVWREIARVLRPGGRVAVSDLALRRPLPDAVRADVEALVGCIAGAALIDDTHAQMAAAGLTDITLTAKPSYIEAMTDWQDPLYLKIMQNLPTGTTPGEYITSLDIAARKPC